MPIIQCHFNMYSEHPAFEKPENENAKIWRYMDFTKLVSLLDKNALYFRRLDCLSDSFEGSYPRANIDKHNIPPTVDTTELLKSIFSSYDNEMEKKLHSQINKDQRKIFFINSWHINNYESAAMWKLYLKNDEGIAVQSTFNRLCKSFERMDRTIWIGNVKYVDYDKERIPEDNSLKLYLHKRKSFEHEQELRAIAQPLDPGLEPTYHITEAFRQILLKQGSSTRGIYINVDLNMLIDNIYISPMAEEWFYDLVKSTIEKYELNKGVIQSSLADKSPLY